MQLRPYQVEAKNAILNEWRSLDKTLLVLTTGLGKTIVFTSVIADRVRDGSKALILAHREELLNQAAEKLLKNTGLLAEFEQGNNSSIGTDSSVVIASIQTMMQDNRLNQFRPDEFSTIVIDEAHHALSASYQKVLQYFNHAKVLGVTATPDRADKKTLAQYFESVAYEYTMREAIRNGYLCPIKALMCPVDIDLTNVKESHGDYQAGDVGRTLELYLEQIADTMAEKCQDRKTVVFLPLVEMSKHFANLLNARGLRAVEVNGESTDRSEVISDFESGKYNVICNSILLSEGWDCPAVDCIVVLRPTKSRALYAQMIGRGLRLYEGKTHLLLLDFLWMTAKHDLCRPSCLMGKDAEYSARVDSIVEGSEVPIDILETNEQAERDVFAERQRALAEELERQRHKKARLVDPLQYFYSINDQDLADYEPVFKWEREPVTDKQKELLEKRGINPDTVECKGKAKKIIDTLLSRQNAGLSTPKQIRLLERYGLKNVGLWKFDEATNVITEIKNNGWKLSYRRVQELNDEVA